MRGHKVCFYGKIRKIIPLTPFYLKHCLTFTADIIFEGFLSPREANVKAEKLLSLKRMVNKYGGAPTHLK